MVVVAGQEFPVGAEVSKDVVEGLGVPIEEDLIAIHKLKILGTREELGHFGSLDGS